jgi:hypothetical protein
VEITMVVALTTTISFSLGTGINFLATMSEQTLGPLQIGWSIAAVVVAVMGSRWLASRRTARLRLVEGTGGQPTPPADSAKDRTSKVPRAA